MEKNIRILTAGLTLEATLNESKTAEAIWEALPMEAKTNLWGEEIYFPIPVNRALEEGAKEVVSSGDLGYWPTGHAFCIFFGPTPASRGTEIRAASPVNIIGKVHSALTILRKVKDGANITLVRA